AIAEPPAIDPLDIEPMGGMGISVAVGGPLGSRGRDKPADDPADVPLPIPSMFWARKMGCGQPTISADANMVLPRAVSRAPCVPIGGIAPPPLDPPSGLAPPIGTSTWRSDSRSLRRSCG